jgi:uncharacterized protein involved in propanediol utilization
MIDDRVVLFAHRDGMVLETLGHRLPPLLVVGCDTQPGVRVDTLGLPPADYDDREVATFGVLRSALRRAVAAGDAALLGKVATASARINQRFLPKPGLADLLELGRRHGGCGIQVAHSGTVAGLVFDASRPDAVAGARRCAAAIESLGLLPTGLIGTEPRLAAAATAAAPPWVRLAGSARPAAAGARTETTARAAAGSGAVGPAAASSGLRTPA